MASSAVDILASANKQHANMLVSNMVRLNSHDSDTSMSPRSSGTDLGVPAASSSMHKLAQLRQNWRQKNTDVEMKVKMLYGDTSVSMSANGQQAASMTVRQVKERLCEGTGGLCADDILIVSGGKQLADTQELANHKKSVFALVRSTAKSMITIPIQCRESCGKTTSTQLTISASARIFYVQSQLHKQKLIPLKPTCQRLMLGTRQLSDEREFIGNYVLAAANTATNRRKRQLHPSTMAPTMHVMETIDTKREVHLKVIVGQNKRPVEHAVDFEIGQTIDKLQDTLVRERVIPPINMGKLDFFLMPGDNVDGSRLTKDEVLLDRQKTLFDYGVTGTSKNVCIRACVLVEQPRAAPVTPVVVDFPTMLTFLGALHAVTKSLGSEPTTPSTPNVSSTSSSAIPVPAAVATEKPATAPMLPSLSAIMSEINPKKRPIASSTTTTTNKAKIANSGAKKGEDKGMFQGLKKGFLFSSSSDGKEKASKLPKH
jgi:hypothetical protein